jgi:alkyl sulfatase BDS1-like metallo-beta-lactamase superfamily hydrolase
MTFLNTPGAVAPAEMLFCIHPFEMIIQAEIKKHTMHNPLTLRGANEFRDGAVESGTPSTASPDVARSPHFLTT